MKDMLRFITCGSVDDGKSTLIGHMLYDAKLIFADQKKSLELESKVSSNGGDIDYSLLLDGLMAEREQGITIDVAYRFFSTEKRSFIVADCPGHEQYTRNMAVGASFADLAIILVDSTKGILTQTKRHARICSFMGINDVVVAINKVDLINYSEDRFNRIKSDFLDLGFDFKSIYFIPVSATLGDNITENSDNTPWYGGVSLLSYLNSIDIDSRKESLDFIFPIQRVCRPNYTFRGFQGQVVGGSICVGDEVEVLPSKEKVKIKSIYVGDSKGDSANKNDSITIEIDREVDISRGDIITNDKDIKLVDGLDTKILWMDDDELVEGKDYLFKYSTKILPCNVLKIKNKIDINSNSYIKSSKLNKNELALCEISLVEKIPVKKFNSCRDLGSFILIDRVTNKTVACGIIEEYLSRDNNLTWQNLDIDRNIRSKQKGQKPFTIWLFGLSGSGKSTLANWLEKKLVELGKHTFLLDGDNVRHGLSKDLGFSEDDRVENIRRIAEVSKILNDGGLISIVACISPYERDREMAKKIVGEDNFIEIFVNATLEKCEERDVKGLYKKARKGEIKNFTGISSKFEKPNKPMIEIDTSSEKIRDSVDKLIKEIIYLVD